MLLGPFVRCSAPSRKLALGKSFCLDRKVGEKKLQLNGLTGWGEKRSGKTGSWKRETRTRKKAICWVEHVVYLSAYH